MQNLFTKQEKGVKSLHSLTHSLKHVLTYLLILSVLLSAVPLEVSAAQNMSSQTNAGSISSDKPKTTEKVISHAADFQTAKLLKELPSAINPEEAREKGHIKRLTELETDDNTLVFENADGTNTLYYFSFPVKYADNTLTGENADLYPVNGTGLAGSIDSARNIKSYKDISLKIKKDVSSFKTESNAVITTFSKYLSEGISLKNENVNVKMFPQISKEKKGILSADGLNVTYTLDDTTKLDYSLTFFGFKENIVVSEYTGCTEYRFTIETNGLKPEKIEGSWYLTDDDGVIRATIGDIIVFTADEKNNTLGSLEITEIVANSKYEATIILDADYLKDPATAYPICIDPTVEVVYKSSSDAGKLADVTINSKASSVGAKDALYIGRSNTAGIQRVLMKFPGLNLSGITASQVTNAYVVLRDLMCQYWTMNVNCHAFTGNVWEENTANWSNVVPNAYAPTPLSTWNVNYPDGCNLSPAHNYRFDITDAVRGWIDGRYNINKGLIFKADDSFEKVSGEAYKTFGSYNRASYKPSLCITYNAAVSLSQSSISLLMGNTTRLKLSTNVSSSAVTWTSSDNTVAAVDTNGTVSAKQAGNAVITASVRNTDGSVKTAQCRVYVIIQSGVYYIRNVNNKKCLMVKNGGADNYSEVVQCYEYQRPEVNENLAQMWKICHIGNGLYSIRPLNKLDMGLDVTKGKADIYKINTTDSVSGIIDDAKWTIQGSSDGFVIKNNNNADRTLQISDTTVAVLKYGDNTKCKWKLEKIASVPSGAYWYNYSDDKVVTNPSLELGVGETKSLSDINLYAIAYSETNISQAFTWTSSNSKVATVDANGTVKGISAGEAIITGKVTRNYKTYSISLNVKVGKWAIIIVPGFGGSNLIDDQGNDVFSGELIDFISAGVDYQVIVNAAESVKKNSEDNSSLTPEIMAKIVNTVIQVCRLETLRQIVADITPSEDDGIVAKSGDTGTWDTYDYCKTELEKAFSSKYEIIFFSYDWRKSNAESAKQLQKMTKQYDRIVFVSHSMGGLVASSWLSQFPEERKKVFKNISVGTPFLGTSMIAYLLADGSITECTWSTGNKTFDFLLDAVANAYQTDILSSMPSALEMLPCEQSNNDEGNYQFLGGGSFEEMGKRLSEYEPSLMNKIVEAKRFQDSLWVGNEHISSTVDSYYLYGNGLDTLQGLTQTSYMRHKKRDDGTEVEVSAYQPYRNSLGDGTVPSTSATINYKYRDKAKEFYSFYYNAKGENDPNDQCEHVSLIRSESVLKYIKEIIESK